MNELQGDLLCDNRYRIDARIAALNKFLPEKNISMLQKIIQQLERICRVSENNSSACAEPVAESHVTPAKRPAASVTSNAAAAAALVRCKTLGGPNSLSSGNAAETSEPEIAAVSTGGSGHHRWSHQTTLAPASTTPSQGSRQSTSKASAS